MGKDRALVATPEKALLDLTSQHGLEPNLELLGNALQQTGHKIQAGKWREAVAQRLRSLKWSSVLADLRPFLERQSDLNMLQPELILKLVTEGT